MALYRKAVNFIKFKYLRKNTLNHKPLSQSRLFWLTFIFGILAAIATTIVITSNNKFIGCADVQCFSNFLEYFAVSIKILSATFFVAGFVAVIHRSKQTHHQIEISLKQNSFKNYLDHKAELAAVLYAFEEEFQVEVKGKHSLYRKLFPRNSTQEVSFLTHADNDGDIFIDNKITNFHKCVDKYNEFGEAYINKEGIKPNQYFTPWLADYLLLTMELGFYEKSTNKIHSDWYGHLTPDLFKGIPKDIEKHILTLGKLLLELQHFCYPTKNERVEIYFPTHYHKMKGLVHLYSQPKN